MRGFEKQFQDLVLSKLNGSPLPESAAEGDG